MPTIEGGRLCEKCDTKMIDFSGMTNLEIIKLHAETEGRVCGYYLPSQLAHPLQEKTEIDRPSLLAKALVGLSTMASTLLLSPTVVVAQTPVEVVDKGADSSLTKAAQRTGQTQDSLILKGRMVDKYGLPMPFASVYVKETEWGVSTDIEGNYTLILKRDDVCQKDSITLVYFVLGYKTIENEWECALFDEGEFWLGEQRMSPSVEVVVKAGSLVGPPTVHVTKYYIKFTPEKKKWWQRGVLGRIFRKRK